MDKNTANKDFFKGDLNQGMQSRDSCVQRETSSSITLRPTGTINVHVKSCNWYVIYIFLLIKFKNEFL